MTKKHVGQLSLLVSIVCLSLFFNNCSQSGFQSAVIDAASTALGSPENPIPGVQNLSGCVAASMKRIPVSSLSEISNAISTAKPGDSIEIQPGTYHLQNVLRLNPSGTSDLPICLRAAQAGTVILESESVDYMALRVSGTFWTIENLTIRGVCASDDLCEHAVQIKEGASHTTIRLNTLVDFNAQIKGSSTAQLSADSVLIEGNHIYDTRPRATSNPTTKIDVVGGKYWMIRGNLIHDFEKGQGDTISYAAFLKGYSRFGTFESNVVACSLNFSGGTRLGLSFGGGTTGPQYCWDYDPATGKGCAFEHESGLMRNNLIINCSDVGILVRDTNKSLITNNLVIDTAGIDSLLDAGHPVPTSEVSRNIVLGQIRDRNGAVSTKQNNLVTSNRAELATWFQNIDQYNFAYVKLSLLKDITSPVPEVTVDMCGQLRTGNLDLGPFEAQDSACFQSVMDRIKASQR